MKTIAVIEDDIAISKLLDEILHQSGYRVVHAYSGTEALLLFERARADLVLLDLMLPGLPGEALLAQIRDVPVIVLSAKAGIGEKVQLLLQGAADYITKPFDTAELLARITVQLRRRPDGARAPLRFAELTLDPASHSAAVEDQPLHLTKTEFALLKLLLQNPGQALAKSQILERISVDTPDCVESSLKVHISNLRRKLRDCGAKVHIETVWGIGFRLCREDK